MVTGRRRLETWAWRGRLEYRGGRVGRVRMEAKDEEGVTGGHRNEKHLLKSGFFINVYHHEKLLFNKKNYQVAREKNCKHLT